MSSITLKEKRKGSADSHKDIRFPLQISDSSKKKVLLYFLLLTIFVLSILFFTLTTGTKTLKPHLFFFFFFFFAITAILYAFLWFLTLPMRTKRTFIIDEKVIKLFTPTKFQVLQKDLVHKFTLSHKNLSRIYAELIERGVPFSGWLSPSVTSTLVLRFELENNKSQVLEISGKEFHPRKFPLILDALEKFAQNKGIDFIQKE